MKRQMLAILVLAAGLTMANESTPANSPVRFEGLFCVKFEDALKNGDRISLDFTGQKGFVRHKEELNSLPEKKFGKDIDAL